MHDPDRVWRERGLIDAVLAGDESAWKVWYEQSYAALERYVLWRCGSLRDLADEILQETWMTAVRLIRRFDPVCGSFQNWLRGLASNTIRNRVRHYLRRSRTQSSLNGDVVGPCTSEARERSEEIAIILSELPEQYERVLRAKYLDQRSVGEIASEWAVSEKSVESLLCRARNAFREAFSAKEQVDGQ